MLYLTYPPYANMQCLSQLKRLYAEGIQGCYMEFAAYNLLSIILHSNNKSDLLSSMTRYLMFFFFKWLLYFLCVFAKNVMTVFYFWNFIFNLSCHNLARQMNHNKYLPLTSLVFLLFFGSILPTEPCIIELSLNLSLRNSYAQASLAFILIESITIRSYAKYGLSIQPPFVFSLLVLLPEAIFPF